MEIDLKAKIDLPMLSINAAEELKRLELKKVTNLKSAKELSNLLKEEISKLAKKDSSHRLDYLTIFSGAYSLTYSPDNLKLIEENPKQYMETIVKKLESPSNLENEELEKLLDFCVKLSDYSAAYKKAIDEWTTSPRF